MTEAEIIEKLKEVDGAHEVYHVISRFTLLRRTDDGNNQEVTVEILDAGPNANQNLRYHCMAKADDGRSATGNPDSSIEFALMNVHWEHLDWMI
jgi:hypothetical protein